jgi:hypothetical protein
MDKFEIETNLAGGTYSTEAKWNEIKAGDKVTVRPDPMGTTLGRSHNDPNALAIYDMKGRHLGYIPRVHSQTLAPLIKDGQIKVSAKLLWVDGPNCHLRCTVSST